MANLLNRREFVKCGAAAAATFSPLSNVASTAAQKKRTIHKAIMYATIGYKGSVMEKFQAVKAAGFEGVEPMSHRLGKPVSRTQSLMSVSPTRAR